MTMTHRLALAISIIALGSGCCGHGSSPHAMPLAPDSMNEQSKAIARTVLAGNTLSLGHSITANADCTSAGISTVRIIQQPEHGHADIARRKGYPSFPKSSDRVECNKVKLPGVFIDYTPDDGFLGTDRLAIEVITPAGDDRIHKYILTVKQ